jgi:hypothetical protein
MQHSATTRYYSVEVVNPKSPGFLAQDHGTKLLSQRLARFRVKGVSNGEIEPRVM